MAMHVDLEYKPVVPEKIHRQVVMSGLVKAEQELESKPSSL